MSAPALPVLGKRHPLTGAPIRAIGFRRDGRPIFPIMGGDPSNDPPERPDDVPQETWDALGDPGKSALVRERTARVQAERDRDTAVRERDAARARPAPPKVEPPKPDPPKTDPAATGQPDIAAIVQQAVAAAIKPFQDAETQRTAEAAASKVRDAVLEAAKPLLHDPSDALANVDLASVVDANGAADQAKVKAALDKVVETKPHLAKSTTRIAPLGIGGGGPVATPDAEKVKAILGEMQKTSGVRVPRATV